MSEKETYPIQERLKLSELYMTKAWRFFKEGEKVFSYGAYLSAVHDLYYAVFHGSKAYLILLGLDPYTHKGVRSLLYMHLGKDYPEICEIFDELMDMKNKYDYDTFATEPDDQKVKLAKERALTFLKTIEEIRLKIQKELL